MVEDVMPHRAPVRPEGIQGEVFIPRQLAVICGNDQHVYNAGIYPVCPGCESLGRLVIDQALSPEILHPRLMAALRKRKEE